MRYITFLFFAIMLILITALLGCAFAPVFHSTSDTELDKLAKNLKGQHLDDLLRNSPSLRFNKSINIGNGNICHEFSYLIVEREDMSKRPVFSGNTRPHKREITFYINIFVDSSGIIYEVLTPVEISNEVIREPYQSELQ